MKHASSQHPLLGSFGPSITTTQVLAGRSLHSMTAIVTGGYSGLGLETARALANAGAAVVVPARNRAKAESAVAGIAGIELAQMDLGDPSSIDRFAADFVASGRSLHILVNSAGIMAAPMRRDPRGFESHFAINHLGHFQLALRLMPALEKAVEDVAGPRRAARVVSVSSRGYRLGGIEFNDPQLLHRPYDKWVAYGQSKTANVLFAGGLDKRASARQVRAFAVHPGTVLTDLARHLSAADLQAFGVSPGDAHGHVPTGQGASEGGDYKTVPQGAATAVWCATAPALEGMGGVYCENVNVAPVIKNGADRLGKV